ncbi:MAG: homocysteine S-methyltransferase family protein [Clostridia bacterium]|nr:homocysteine S-methyltransferase family protein [Clostridia bacterium]
MKITQYMKEHLLLLDGGMGTLLQAEGLAPGESPETWNLTHPEVITAIHKAYYDAGSNVVNTNTFGANLLNFSKEELETIIPAAVANAKHAREISVGTQEKFIALDIGPSGKLLKPLGTLDFEDAVAAFAETVRIGADCGVDLIIVETMNDSYETKAALLAAKEGCDLPVFVTNAYGADGKLMTGADPEAMVAMLEGMGADAIGVNCSLGPEALAPIVQDYLRLASVPVILKPNAGLPVVQNGKTVFDVSAEDFACDVARLVHDGVRVAGGCCGTTPAYIAALKREINSQGLIAVPVLPKHRTVVSSYTHAVTFGDRPVLIGERINPTGKKKLKEALRARDMNYILNEGITQAEAGVHILDVNVGLPEINEPAMLTEAVCELQAVCDLPLQLDTSDPVAMEAALRRYNGKALVNSVNGKRESMAAIFPLVKKYGGAVIALTLDETGIPATAEGRLEIAKRILATAETYGIDKKDIIFDTLAMTVSADPQAATETLRALTLIREELGCHTSLGVSNVSFGLPARDLINGTFFAMALERGLSAAIMNPFAQEMRKTYFTYLALSGKDENFVDYIAFAETQASAAPSVQTTPAVATKSVDAEGVSELQSAIVKGLRTRAAYLTEAMLATIDPMDVVQSHVIPALDRVGKGFETGKIYLPQLLMSAEASAAAFEKVKAAVKAQQNQAETKLTIVIATVKGDIHDIGKNIVKLLLENYGHNVIDLGRDVPPEVILDKVLETKAPIAALSALMTTTVPAMAETISLIHGKAPFCKVLVGGAVLNPEYAASIGADAYGKDAMESVRYAEAVWAKSNK